MAEDNLPYIYGLELPTRALATAKATEDDIVFFIGTQSLRTENQLVSVTFDEDSSTAIPIIYSHKCGEIWQIISSPSEKQVVATVYSSYDESNAKTSCQVWKLPELDDEKDVCPSPTENSNMQSLQSLAKLDHSDTPSVVSSSWHPEEANMIAVFSTESVVIWDIERNKQSKLADIPSRSRLYTGVWSPHRKCSEVFLLCDSTLKIIDSTSGQQVCT